MNIAHLLLRAARVHPQRPALALGDRVLATYAELAQRVGASPAAWRQRCSRTTASAWS
jgi:acyl-CoA synthetase (AMP-forming)/AMP-acid ligase II